MILYYLREAEYDGKHFRIGNSRITLYSSFCTLEVAAPNGGYQASYEYDDNDLYLSILNKLKGKI